MTQTRTNDVQATVKQILDLEEAGCEIIRVTVPDMESAKAIKAIKKQINIPLVADIHFQYLLAIEAAKQGVDKVRINPGNIGGTDRVKEVVRVCKEKNIPIRIGVNMGSLEKDLYAKRFDYPLHVGITEAGTLWAGSIKSAVGIGSILAEGIGDTIRVSIADDPKEQVKVGWEILKSAGLRQKGVEVIACPTCGRTEINLIDLAKRVEAIVSKIDAPIKVAVMGCVVNGPGEASFADIGVCGGRNQGAIFKKGKLVRTLREEELFPVFIDEIKKVLVEKGYKSEINKLHYDKQ